MSTGVRIPHSPPKNPAKAGFFLWVCFPVELLGFKDVLFHAARHTFVTRLASGGHDIGIVKNVARHSTITMTDSYMHTEGAANQAAVDSLCERFEDRERLFPSAPSARGHLRALG